MPVLVQKTPNPNALKFILPQRVFERPLNISTPEEAAQNPLAAKLFSLEPVYNVFMAQDFITVNKLPCISWDRLEEQVRQIICEYFELGDEMA